MQERLTDIEIKLAHAEQSLNELSDVIFRQQRQIDKLERLVESLKERLQASEAGGQLSGPADEKPPHY